ncbi:MAG: DUF1428 domain-containing protein, partial [Balneolales bacterium]|nr:DUF1428 domain-containing protein [Balneolales bacterium]
MAHYIDGFVFPVPKIHVNEYKSVAERVAKIWKEYGALDYFEYIGEDLKRGVHVRIRVNDGTPVTVNATSTVSLNSR